MWDVVDRPINGCRTAKIASCSTELKKKQNEDLGNSPFSECVKANLSAAAIAIIIRLRFSLFLALELVTSLSPSKLTEKKDAISIPNRRIITDLCS